MTIGVLFETPGHIDIRAFTTFGVNVKPATSTPIGYFGTGLKYAIAVLVRHKIPVTLWIGSKQYEFYTKEGDFRGENFNFVMMRKKHWLASRWSYEQLPFTTELGKNWKLWQAFRELYANTLDEHGTVEVVDGPLPAQGDNEKTWLLVERQVFVEEYHNKDKTFLPNSIHNQKGLLPAIQVIKSPSKHLYWRGMRVMDFDRDQPAMYTWNIIEPMDLTEDRTLKYTWAAQSVIGNFVAASDDEQLIRSVITTDDSHFESRIDWAYVGVPPSPTFKRVMEEVKRKGSYIWPAATSYFNRYAPASVKRNDTVTDVLNHLISLVNNHEWSQIGPYILDHPTHFQTILKVAKERYDNEEKGKAVKLAQGPEILAGIGAGISAPESPF